MTIGLERFGHTLGLYEMPKDEQVRVLALYQEQHKTTKKYQPLPKGTEGDSEALDRLRHFGA